MKHGHSRRYRRAFSPKRASAHAKRLQDLDGAQAGGDVIPNEDGGSEISDLISAPRFSRTHTGRNCSSRGTLKDSISFTITPTLPIDQRAAFEHLLFFNANQHRVLPGIQQSTASYGVPEIIEHQGSVRIRVGDMQNVQTLFAVSELGPPLGVAVFVHLSHERFVVLHLLVEPRLRSTVDVNTPVLLELMRKIRSTARRLRGVDRVELVYYASHAVRLSGEIPERR
jgi:hypothetical protein